MDKTLSISQVPYKSTVIIGGKKFTFLGQDRIKISVGHVTMYIFENQETKVKKFFNRNFNNRIIKNDIGDIIIIE